MAETVVTSGRDSCCYSFRQNLSQPLEDFAQNSIKIIKRQIRPYKKSGHTKKGNPVRFTYNPALALWCLGNEALAGAICGGEGAGVRCPASVECRACHAVDVRAAGLGAGGTASSGAEVEGEGGALTGAVNGGEGARSRGTAPVDGHAGLAVEEGGGGGGAGGGHGAEGDGSHGSSALA